MELLSQKEYTLLSEVNYFDNKNEIKKTKKVILKALKLCDADEVIDLLRINKLFKTLEFLATRNYITVLESDAKTLKLDDLHYITASALFKEYEENFLDLLPFLPQK